MKEIRINVDIRQVFKEIYKKIISNTSIPDKVVFGK